MLTLSTSCTVQEMTKLVDKTWISPAKIQIRNLGPGSSVKQNVRIHNGNETATEFLVYYRTPDYVEASFVTAPADARNWLTIGEEILSLAPRQTKEIQVVLNLPEDAQIPERWEFWIAVKENNGSQVVAELASRWLITMR
jgi:hypothetical protein